MPKVHSRYAARVEKAFGFHKKHPTLSVPELMKLANFKQNEVEDRAIRMCIYRCIKNWTVIPKEANNPPVTVTIQAGYDAEHLRATIVKKEQVERVNEPNTVAHQVALVNTKGHIGRFHVTHGAHMTCNDLFIAVEMSARQKERANDERKKKLALQLQDVEEKALAILSQKKAIQLLTVKELDVLLAWHQAPKVPGAKKVNKLVQWQTIVASREAPPLFA